MEPPNEPLETATIMAKPQDKVIISCAVTGAMHTPTMSPYLPITPDQIAEQSIEAAEAGAAILHLHARNPVDGSPTPDPKIFDQFVPRIKAATDAVINITRVGGTQTMQVRTFTIGSTPTTMVLTTTPQSFRIGSLSGLFLFAVGAELVVGANQMPGDYRGNYTVILNYM